MTHGEKVLVSNPYSQRLELYYQLQQLHNRFSFKHLDLHYHHKLNEHYLHKLNENYLHQLNEHYLHNLKEQNPLLNPQIEVKIELGQDQTRTEVEEGNRLWN
jgi:hypothetical protein